MDKTSAKDPWLILMWILDPGSALEKKDPDPGREHFFEIYWIFLTKQNCQIIFFIFFLLIFMLKLDAPFKNQEIFIISIFQ